MEAELDCPLLGLKVGTVNANSGGCDVLEQNLGIFEREGDIELAAQSEFGSPVLCLVLMLDDDESLVEGDSLSSIADNSLNQWIDTSMPYLMSLYLET